MAAGFLVWVLSFLEGLFILDPYYMGNVGAGESKILEKHFTLVMSCIPSYKSEDLRPIMVLWFLFGELSLPSFSLVELLESPFDRSSTFK